jgi:hypothetical protein
VTDARDVIRECISQLGFIREIVANAKDDEYAKDEMVSAIDAADAGFGWLLLLADDNPVLIGLGRRMAPLLFLD